MTDKLPRDSETHSQKAAKTEFFSQRAHTIGRWLQAGFMALGVFPASGNAAPDQEMQGVGDGIIAAQGMGKTQKPGFEPFDQPPDELPGPGTNWERGDRRAGEKNHYHVSEAKSLLKNVSADYSVNAYFSTDVDRWDQENIKIAYGRAKLLHAVIRELSPEERAALKGGRIRLGEEKSTINTGWEWGKHILWLNFKIGKDEMEQRVKTYAHMRSLPKVKRWPNQTPEISGMI